MTGMIFVIVLLALAYFADAWVRAGRSQEMNRDLERFRERRRIRKASRR